MGMQSNDGGFAAFDADNDSTWLNHAAVRGRRGGDGSVVCRSDRAGARDDGGGRLSHRPSGGATRDPVAQAKSVAGGRMVGTLGGQLYLRYFLGVVGPARDRRRYQRAVDKRAVEWLKSKQNPDGGWGESPLSDTDPAWHGRGTSTASQTAWALIGLIAGEPGIGEHAMRGAQWLSERQNDEGAWDERESTGNGFPNHFYLRYDLYAHYFPLMALGRFRRRLAETAPH